MQSLALLVVLVFGSASASAGMVAQWRLVYESAVTADSQSALTNDVLEVEPGAGTVASGYAISADGLRINGFVYLGTETQAFVTDRYVDLPGGLVVGPRSVVRDDSGGFSVAFDGEAAGLPAGARIDALFQTSEGHWVLSTDVHVELNGQVYADGDLIGHDGQSFFLVASEAALGLEGSADVSGIAQGTGGRWLIALKTGGRTLDGLTYFAGDVLRADDNGRLTGIELRSREAPLSISAGLNAISAEPAPDELFSDRFQE